MASRRPALALATVVLLAACQGSIESPPTRRSPGPGTFAPSPGAASSRSSAPTVRAATASTSPRDLAFSTSGSRTDFTITSIDLAEIEAGGPDKDGIPAIDQPRFESVQAASGWINPATPVIAFEMDGDARAYPIAI